MFRWTAPRYGSNLAVEQVEQVAVVFADDFDDDVEGPGGQHDIVDGLDGGQFVGDLGGVPVHRTPIMAWRPKPI